MLAEADPPEMTLPTPTHARAMRLIAHSDQGGRPDGQQIVLDRGFAYIGHIWSDGFTVMDVRDPANPRPAGFFPSPPNTWSLHLQAADGLLLVVHARHVFRSAAARDERGYYQPTLGEEPAATGDAWSSGIAVYDVSIPGSPREIGFMPVGGVGPHRIWYAGGRWAYASIKFDGFTDHVFATIDLRDPARPEIAGRWWLPGMHRAAGETPDWPLARGRYGLHHPTIGGTLAFCAWRDAGLVILDVADPTAPRLVAWRRWAPPFGGGTHNALPLPGRRLAIVLDEAVLDGMADGVKPIWVFDIREPANPVSIATLPPPDDRDYAAVGGHFGPHNVYENPPGGFASDTLVFSTWQNAGVRVHDISDPYRPREVGALVPPAPRRLVDPRPGRPVVLHSADVYVDPAGVIYCTDWSGGGLHIMEFDG